MPALHPSNTIGAFALQGGCGLTFLGDVPAIGLQGGSVSGMAVNGTTPRGGLWRWLHSVLHTSPSGMPVPNNDLRNSTGFTTGGAALIQRIWPRQHAERALTSPKMAGLPSSAIYPLATTVAGFQPNGGQAGVLLLAYTR